MLLILFKVTALKAILVRVDDCSISPVGMFTIKQASDPVGGSRGIIDYSR